MTDNLFANANTTNANSPPPLSNNATRTPSASDNRFGSIHRGTRVAAPNVTAFNTSKANAPTTMVGHSASTNSESKVDPASIKKIPNKIPLNGNISA